MAQTLILSGRAGQALAHTLARSLHATELKNTVREFADGEMEVELSGSVKGARVLVVQTFPAPVHEALMELLMLVDAAQRGGATHITAVLPYLAYSRQDREIRPGVAVSADVLARLLQAAGVDAVTTVDIHSARVEMNYKIPFTNLSAMELLAATAAKALQGERICVVSPDSGGMVRAQGFAHALRAAGAEASVAMIDKVRATPNQVASATLVGQVEGCHCVLVDDMIDTAGTLCAAAAALREGGAAAVSAAAVHGLFNGPAVERLMGQGFTHLWVTDTLPLREDAGELKTLKTVPVAGLLARALS